jgi:hypothetical protein
VSAVVLREVKVLLLAAGEVGLLFYITSSSNVANLSLLPLSGWLLLQQQNFMNTACTRWAVNGGSSVVS